MGFTEYVGARYVPIFGRLGEETIEWDNSKPYEPLTIVLHEGNSFTSRQYVPVGIEIDNQEYWAETGNYNAQVEQYRREVISYLENVLALKNDFENFQSMKIENYEDDYAIVNIITLPKSKYVIKMDINRTLTTPGTLAEYVKRKKPFLAINFTNGSSFIYNRTIYGNGEYAGSNSDCFYNINSETNNIEIVQGDGVTNYFDLIDEYDNGAFSSQAVVINGIGQTIDNTVELYKYGNPRRVLAFDDKNWYIVSIIGRIGNKIGYTLQQIKDLAISRNWKNACVLDGGGSTQTIFGKPYARVTPIIDSDMMLRPAYYCIVFNERDF